jgi:hypothetical protein
MIHIGFTGTRKGMTRPQQWSVDQAICDIIGGDTRLRVVAHHGDCIGADEAFHASARMYGCAVCIHPPTDASNAAGIPESVSFDGSKIVRRPAKPYLARNADIVNESDYMIAAPLESTEMQWGGTWATIRMTRRSGKPLAIVMPDGTISYERWPSSHTPAAAKGEGE